MSLVTPADVRFSRANFLSGGPGSVGQRISLRVFPRDRLTPIYQFDKMAVHQIAQMDAEHTMFVQASNRTVKLYSFDRAVLMLSIQLIAPDGVGDSGYRELLWLYENELKISAAALKQRRIELTIHNMRYYGAVTSMVDGYTADSEQVVPVSMEFLVTSAEHVRIPDSGPTPVTSTGSREVMGAAVALPQTGSG